MAVRQVARVVESVWQAEGRDARVRRSIGRPDLTNIDPFILLDEFEGAGKDGAGFPDHPHRGFETVTYLLEGEFTHEDSTGRRGVLRPGGVQWMTAGRGVLHSEMPGWERTHGLQLWVNLPREQKMVPPAYQELTKEQVPEESRGGVTVRVIAGRALGVTSPVMTRTPTMYLDFSLEPGSCHKQEVPEGWTTLAYTLAGASRLGGREVAPHHTVIFGREGGAVEVGAGPGGARLVLIAGRPIGEPVVQRGPFVLCSEEEAEQAVRDYRRGENGFEGSRTWRSVEGNK
jgi:redox-sensitive bicupin YhaK (pirin superfamily)